MHFFKDYHANFCKVYGINEMDKSLRILFGKEYLWLLNELLLLNFETRFNKASNI